MPMHVNAHRRWRLLLIAPTCDGTDVSEPAVAYEWVSRLAARHEVTVLTYRRRARRSVRSQLPDVRLVEWEEWPLVAHAATLNNLLQPSYAGFYVHARRWIEHALARGERFDIVHQLTPMALRYPSPAAGLVPRLVLGPMAGALPTPTGFLSEIECEQWYTKLRDLDRWRFRHDRPLRRSMGAASVLIGAAPYVREVLADVPVRRFEVMSELGISELPRAHRTSGERCGTLKGLFVGRIVRTKGVRDAIRAIAALRDLPEVTLDVAGDGTDRLACEAEARRLGVNERVHFHGWMERAALDRMYAAADLLVFPSFREPTGGVIIEAMSHGLPVLTADCGGPADLVTSDCGVRVPPRDPRQYATGLAEAMGELAFDPGKRSVMGEAARRRVSERFLWPAKLGWLEHLYEELLQGDEGLLIPQERHPGATGSAVRARPNPPDRARAVDAEAIFARADKTPGPPTGKNEEELPAPRATLYTRCVSRSRSRHRLAPSRWLTRYARASMWSGAPRRGERGDL
jgi:glycosyltransferase involved in cell wall biosynthesis